ncbi:uncharacterized protein LOC116236150 [Phasianus colchicus]|uniref:uncharacterized protein LOC116236150 n=1 Tax=Phasianus colchicus TaxID=9054 RepID=UPI00129ECE04|nr:uncharacterized protein LOC116236150 [Phasianus colchicus]XP_031460546.1 uncharacterized protein LOC116236150 [Phasianus colchicus]
MDGIQSSGEQHPHCSAAKGQHPQHTAGMDGMQSLGSSNPISVLRRDSISITVLRWMPSSWGAASPLQCCEGTADTTHSWDGWHPEPWGAASPSQCCEGQHSYHRAEMDGSILGSSIPITQLGWMASRAWGAESPLQCCEGTPSLSQHWDGRHPELWGAGFPLQCWDQWHSGPGEWHPYKDSIQGLGSRIPIAVLCIASHSWDGWHHPGEQHLYHSTIKEQHSHHRSGMDGIQSPGEQNSHHSAVKGQHSLHTSEVGGTQSPGEQNSNHRTGMDGIQAQGSSSSSHHPGTGYSPPSSRLTAQMPAAMPAPCPLCCINQDPSSSSAIPFLALQLSKRLPGDHEPICKVSSYILSTASSAATQLPDVSASPPLPKLFLQAVQSPVTGRRHWEA